MITSGAPNADFFAGFAENVALAYSAAGISLNVICSILITARILWTSRRMEATLGREVSRTYTSAAAIIVESMLPYSVFGFVYLITLGVNSPTSVFFLSLYVMFTVSASHWLIRTRHALTLAAHR